MGRLTSVQVQVKDRFRALPEYCVDPLEITAIGLKLGQSKMEKARAWARERAMGEFAIIGDSGVHVALRPPFDSRPPEPWLHEFVQPVYLAQARGIVTDG